MIRTGSKFFIAGGVLALLAAAAYGTTTAIHADGLGLLDGLTGAGAVDYVLGPLTFGWAGPVGDHVGYVTLLGIAVALGGLGVMSAVFRDNDVDALAELAGTGVAPEPAEPTRLSAWPIVAALGAGMVIVGLANSPGIFVIGLVFLVVAGAEWVVRTWADQATGDPEVNQVVRNRLMFPLEIPVGATLAVVGAAIAFSRVFLTVSKLGAVVVASVVSAIVLAVAFVLAARPKLSKGLVAGLAVVGGLLVLGAGIGGAVSGEREFENEAEHGGEEEPAEGEEAPADGEEAPAEGDEGDVPAGDEGGDTGSDGEAMVTE